MFGDTRSGALRDIILLCIEPVLGTSAVNGFGTEVPGLVIFIIDGSIVILRFDQTAEGGAEYTRAVALSDVLAYDLVGDVVWSVQVCAIRETQYSFKG